MITVTKRQGKDDESLWCHIVDLYLKVIFQELRPRPTLFLSSLRRFVNCDNCFCSFRRSATWVSHRRGQTKSVILRETWRKFCGVWSTGEQDDVNYETNPMATCLSC